MSNIVKIISKEDLKKFHTGTLMKRRQALLSCEESFQLSDRFEYETESDPLETGYIEFKDTATWKQAYNELKEILSTREHWPNKPERKTVRIKNINENRRRVAQN